MRKCRLCNKEKPENQFQEYFNKLGKLVIEDCFKCFNKTHITFYKENVKLVIAKDRT